VHTFAPEGIAGVGTVQMVYRFRGSSPVTDFASLVQSYLINWRPMTVAHVTRPVSEDVRALADNLCEQHPAISTYEGVFGGVPHLAGLRISVPDILEQLYLTGSIAAVQNIYAPDVSEDQIKEAIAYAQDFLESALSS
jgi:uncharacterized protein (DUF433 family)